jgi:hypothetical protein
MKKVTKQSVCFLFGLLFESADVGGVFLRNAVWLSPNYTTLYPVWKPQIQPKVSYV